MAIRTQRMRNRVSILIVVGLLAFLLCFAYRLDNDGAVFKKGLSGVPPRLKEDGFDLTGTWRMQNGVHFNFRMDGSGRTRQTTRKKRTHYFRWQFDGQSSKLTLIDTSDNVWAIARDAILGETRTVCGVENVSADEFDLTIPGQGTLRMARVQDPEIENAP